MKDIGFGCLQDLFQESIERSLSDEHIMYHNEANGRNTVLMAPGVQNILSLIREGSKSAGYSVRKSR